MDSPTVATGFAQVSKNVLKKLHDTGKYDITVVGINYHGTLTKEQMEKHPYSFTPAMPSGYSDPYGRGRVIQILQGVDREIKPPFDIVFTIQDHFILAGSDELAQGYNFAKRIKEIQAEIIANEKVDIKYLFNWIGYFPVDGTLQTKWVKEGIGYCDYPVAYTEFGKQEILKFDDELLKLQNRLKVIYHGVNTKDFYPLPKQEIIEFRKKYFPENMPEDAFLIVNISRNQTRKDIASTIKAFAEYKKINPKAYLYLHMKQYDHGGDLWEIAKQFGLNPGQDMMLPSNFEPQFGFPIEFINKIYNSADVLITTTLGEGWGFINTEAMAVKKPIITPMNTAMPEIVGIDEPYIKEPMISYIEDNIHKLRGIPIKSGVGLNDWICLGAMDNGVVRPKVDIQDVVDKLDWTYKNPNKVQQIAQNGYNWVQDLTWENICKQWEEIFDNAYLELEKERKLGHIKDKPNAVINNGKHIIKSDGTKYKMKPNDKCYCNSGKKYKLCCGKI